MKLIKLFLLIPVSLCVTTLLHAQELKPGMEKPVEMKAPEGPQTNTPSPLPELKPQPQAAAPADEAPAKKAETPSSPTAREKELPEPNAKPEVKTIDLNNKRVPGGEEGRKIMSGNTTKPNTEVSTPGTSNPKLIPPVVKPAQPKNGQQQ